MVQLQEPDWQQWLMLREGSWVAASVKGYLGMGYRWVLQLSSVLALEPEETLRHVFCSKQLHR